MALDKSECLRTGQCEAKNPQIDQGFHKTARESEIRECEIRKSEIRKSEIRESEQSKVRESEESTN